MNFEHCFLCLGCTLVLSDFFSFTVLMPIYTFLDLIVDSTEYVDCKYGLYPKPLGRSAKLATVSKIKAKFRFIGKLLAKALMDSRILDLPMNPIIYSWLLGQQAVLTPSDLSSYDPSIAASYSHLQEMSAKVRTIQSDTNLVSVGCVIILFAVEI